ncbi:MAG: hypothetical protein IPL25_10135 [Saprospiraceae bacterium]|nr:hypothetical protein [Candidatus Vicinibacter affinis]
MEGMIHAVAALDFDFGIMYHFLFKTANKKQKEQNNFSANQERVIRLQQEQE